MTDTSEPQRCAECDCEDGDCNWIAPAPDTSRVAVERLLKTTLNVEAIGEMARVCRALLAEREALRKENGSMRETLTAEWEDMPDEFTKEIEAAHPFREPKDFRRYNLAQAMVSARHSKLELIKLVAWLLTFRATAAKGEGA